MPLPLPCRYVSQTINQSINRALQLNSTIHSCIHSFIQAHQPINPSTLNSIHPILSSPPIFLSSSLLTNTANQVRYLPNTYLPRVSHSQFIKSSSHQSIADLPSPPYPYHPYCPLVLLSSCLLVLLLIYPFPSRNRTILLIPKRGKRMRNVDVNAVQDWLLKAHYLRKGILYFVKVGINE